jgi:uncharacterized membrane protein YedE/YeeE
LGLRGQSEDVSGLGWSELSVGAISCAERMNGTTTWAILVSGPWPWYVAGPAIGLFVPALLIIGNALFGVSSSLRHTCAAVFPRNLLFVLGILVGGFLASQYGGPHNVAISEATKTDLAKLGIHDFSGLAPSEMFHWSALLSFRGFVLIVVGGFLVGFGTAYAGGCTSGHAISGLADLQLPSLIAVVGFFAGGLIATHFILPLLL